MDNEIVKGKIIAQLEVIISQVQHLEQYTKLIPQIEIDLALSNVHRLYDQFQELNHSNKFLKILIENPQAEKNILASFPLYENISDIPEQMIAQAIKPLVDSEKRIHSSDIQSVVEINTDFPPLAFETTSKEESKQAVKQVEKPYRDPATIDMFAEEELVIEKPEKVEEILPISMAENNEAVNEYTKAEQEIEIKPESETISEEKNIDEPIPETPQEPALSKSLKEHLMEMRESLKGGSHLPKHPIANLKSAIGINEKFLFINELFKGDMKAYNDFVAEIDETSLKETAVASVNKNKEHFNWAETSKAYATLIHFIDRKFL